MGEGNNQISAAHVSTGRAYVQVMLKPDRSWQVWRGGKELQIILTIGQKAWATGLQGFDDLRSKGLGQVTNTILSWTHLPSDMTGQDGR